MMKSVLLLIGIFLCHLSFLQAQEENETPTYYWEFHYIKSKTPDYVSAEREAKAIHMERIKQDKLVFWGLYRVEYPTGISAEYDYVTLNIYEGADQYANRWNGVSEIAKSAKVDGASLSKKFTDSRDIVSSEVFISLDNAWSPPEETAPAQYVVYNRMKVPPGMGGQYVRLAMEIFKPYFKAAAEAGHLRNWWLLQRRMPLGSDYGYSYITLDVFQSMEQLLAPMSEEVWTKAHGGKSMSELLGGKNVNDFRDRTRGDVWRVITNSSQE